MPSRLYLGRHVYGFTALFFAAITLAYHDFNGWQQIAPLGNLGHRDILLLFAVIVELFGGVTIQWSRTARAGSLALGSLYLFFAFMWVPTIVAQPLVYDGWGNFFEQFSIVSGATIVYATAGKASSQSPVLARFGYYGFSLCVVSFMIEQIYIFKATAEFVPKWIPPGQVFWAVTTTVAFGLAAISLFAGRVNLLASRLLTLMIAGFGLLVWLPRPFLDPHRQFNWAGNAQNLAILGAACVVMDYLARNQSGAPAYHRANAQAAEQPQPIGSSNLRVTRM